MNDSDNVIALAARQPHAPVEVFVAVVAGIELGVLLSFTYTNWRGQEHRYVIEPEGKIEFGPYDQGGMHPGQEPSAWVMHGKVVTRDGDPRPEMGTRRRTFLMAEMRDIEGVARG